MEPYVDKHLEEICAAHDEQCMEAWIQKQHKIRFMTWTRGESDEARLASDPSTQITIWKGYDIYGYRFHIKEKDKKSTVHNSGV
jgi:hypothetical protein